MKHRPHSIVAVTLIALASTALAQDRGGPGDEPTRLQEIPLRVKYVPSNPVIVPGGQGGAPGGPLAGNCPQVESTLNTSHDFNDPTPTVIVQGGFAENEIAAATYNVPADDFPVILDEAWILFGTSGATVTTTTRWSLLIWEGTPTAGNLLFEVSSDDVLFPHLVMPPGNNGVYIVIQTDPQDPVVITDNGSSRFTIGFRIDEHHNQTQNPCLIAPPSTSNAFPTTDIDGLQFAAQNWLFGVNCGILGCPSNGGWATFAALPSFCTPSGDWIMRALWRSATCTEFAGACCFPDGSPCQTIEEADCTAQGGSYQGDGITCFEITCPEPTGACCLSDFSCAPDVTEIDCVSGGGTWQGAETDCSGNPCTPGVGACCFEETGGCLDFDFDTCEVAGGIFQGEGTDCATVICFPLGACCLPTGDCMDDGGLGLSPEDCAAMGGVFEGDGTDCGGTSCPLPDGACCLSNGNCLVLTEADCGVVAGTWSGLDTDCEDGDQNGTADDCEANDCPADLDDSGDVGFSDLLAVLAAWGPCAACPEDIDQSGDVGFSDLLVVLAAWGPCP